MADHPPRAFSYHLSFPCGRRILVRGLPRETLETATRVMGGVVLRSSDDPGDTQDVSVYPLQESSELRETLLALLPGEEIHCTHGSGLHVYFRDGKVEFPADRPTSKVFLLDTETKFTSPMMAAILRTLALQGALVLHGAGILLGELVVLALGASGSGKSAFAAAALSQGYKVISDDLVLVCEGGARQAVTGKPELYPMRPDMYLRPDTVQLLPHALRKKLTRVQLFQGEKMRLMRQQAQASFSDSATLGCILALQSGSRTPHGTLFPLHQAAGLAAVIAANTYLSTMRAPAKRPLMATANRLVSSTPVFSMSTGTDLLRHPRRELTLIQSLLQQHLS